MLCALSGAVHPSPTPAPNPPPAPPVPPPTPAPPGAPNVLLVLVDDLRPWLPFYGAERLVAPNLARLAASGVQFNNSYVQQAVCSPTRNSFMTGRTPDHTRLWNFKGSFRSNGVDASGKLGKGTAPWIQIYPISLPHFRLYEVVSIHMRVLPYT